MKTKTEGGAGSGAEVAPVMGLFKSMHASWIWTNVTVGLMNLRSSGPRQNSLSPVTVVWFPGSLTVELLVTQSNSRAREPG